MYEGFTLNMQLKLVAAHVTALHCRKYKNLQHFLANAQLYPVQNAAQETSQLEHFKMIIKNINRFYAPSNQLLTIAIVVLVRRIVEPENYCRYQRCTFFPA